MTDRAQYIRFRDAVMTPGRGGNDITKARIAAASTGTVVAPRDELMEEIIIGDHWVLLRAKRRGPDGDFIAERCVHASNVRDYEPALPEKAQRKERNAA